MVDSTTWPVLMDRIDLKTGFSCNNRCIFCVQGKKRDIHRNKTTEELEELLQEGRTRAASVVLTGGEVTIRHDLPHLVAYAKKLGYEVIQIQTNARMFAYTAFAQRIIDAGVTEVSPAIHGPTAEVHDALTCSSGSFDQTVRGTRVLVKAGIPILMNSVITRQNFRLLPETARLFVSLRVRQFQLAFVHALGTAGENFDEVVPRYSEIAPFVHEALDIGISAGITVMTEAIPYCFMRGYEQYVAERIIPDTTIYDAESTLENYTTYRLTEGKLKGPPCESCRMSAECEGPWREYPEHFGWDELDPF